MHCPYTSRNDEMETQETSVNALLSAQNDSPQTHSKAREPHSSNS